MLNSDVPLGKFIVLICHRANYSALVAKSVACFLVSRVTLLTSNLCLLNAISPIKFLSLYGNSKVFFSPLNSLNSCILIKIDEVFAFYPYS